MQCRWQAASAPMLVEQLSQRAPVKHAAVIRRQSRLSTTEVDTATPTCELPLTAAGESSPQFNPARIGVGEVWLERGAFQQGSVKLNIEGVVDGFGHLSVPEAKRKLTIGAVPKAKDDSKYYLKVAHEAAEGASPALALDTKLAPVFNRRVFRYFDPTVKLDADVGFGQLKGKETTETTNTIKIGASLTGVFTTGRSTLQAVRFAPIVSLEADRDFTEKKNLIVEPDVNLYMPWMNHGRALRSRRAYVHRLSQTPPDKWEDVDEDSVDFRKIAGFSADITLGVEAGHALREGKVENDAKTSTVVVPTHGIFRIRPKFQTTIEIWRFSVTGNLTPRFVWTTKPSARWPTGWIRRRVWRAKSPHSSRSMAGGTTARWACRSASIAPGHVAFSTIYKRGSAPPTFGEVNTVQSGLTIKNNHEPDARSLLLRRRARHLVRAAGKIELRRDVLARGRQREHDGDVHALIVEP